MAITVAADPNKPPATSLYADADGELGREQRYWLGNLYAALTGYIGVVTTILVIVGLTWARPHRGWIVLVSLLALAYTLILYILRHHIATSRRRLWVFTSGNLAGFDFLTAMCALDGGVASPMTYLFVIPMLYLAIGFPVRSILLCGGNGLACYAVMAWFSRGPVSYLTLMVQLMALGNGFLIAVIAAVHREHKDRELYKLRQQLEVMATTDALTGCLNQRAFTAALGQEVARSARHGHALSLLVIDIDHFKTVNDRYGHMTGDEVLRQVGAALRATARHADVVGRPGGDEMAMLAPETEGEAGRALAERLRRRVAALDLAVDITLSIGVYSTVPSTEDAATLFGRADRALYQAKTKGRNTIEVFDEPGPTGPVSAPSSTIEDASPA